MSEMMTPESPLFANRLLPKEFALQFKSDGEKVFKSAAFKFLSTSAAAASYLGRASQQENILRRFVEQGIQRCGSTSKERLRINELLLEYNQAFDGLGGVRDLMQAFSNSVLLPLLAHDVRGPQNLPKLASKDVEIVNEQLREIAFSMLFEGRSLLEISRLNRAWHRLVSRHPVGIREGVRWYPIIPEVRLSSEYTICAPTTPAELILEGQAMDNCLRTGLYTSSCLLGHVAVLSLRHIGRPVATITLAPDAETGRWAVTEYNGINNKAISQESFRQLSLFKTKLANGDIPVGSEGVGQTLESIAALKDAKISRLERTLGLNLEQYPSEALAFYSHAVHFKTPAGEVPLLRHFDFQSYKQRLLEILRNSRTR
jgi:hypothetical protein